jgi:Trk K+ transport system NAD-binding subunit
VVFGLGRYGSRLLRQLRDAGVRVIGVDFDPEAVRALRAEGLPVHYGDAEDPDFLESLPLAAVRCVITTLPQPEASRALLHALQSARYTGAVAGAARDTVHARLLAAAGVAPVFNPFDDAADHAAQQLAHLLRQPETRP